MSKLFVYKEESHLSAVAGRILKFESASPRIPKKEIPAAPSKIFLHPRRLCEPYRHMLDVLILIPGMG